MERGVRGKKTRIHFGGWGVVYSLSFSFGKHKLYIKETQRNTVKVKRFSLISHSLEVFAYFTAFSLGIASEEAASAGRHEADCIQ